MEPCLTSNPTTGRMAVHSTTGRRPAAQVATSLFGHTTPYSWVNGRILTTERSAAHTRLAGLGHWPARLDSSKKHLSNSRAATTVGRGRPPTRISITAQT